MVAIDFANLLRCEIGGYVGEIATPYVIPPLEDILKDILHIAVIAHGDTFAADFIESLAACCYVLFNAWVAFFGKHSGNIAGVSDTEAICPWIAAHSSRIVILPIAYRVTHHVAILSDNFKHCRFAGADVTPKP